MSIGFARAVFKLYQLRVAQLGRDSPVIQVEPINYRKKTHGNEKASTMKISGTESVFVSKPRTAPSIAVIIPTLNEAEGIRHVIDGVHKALHGLSPEIVVVDGQSVDNTDGIAAQRGTKVLYQRRTGYGDALRTGFLYARHDLKAKIIAMIDADSTYDSADLLGLIQPIIEDRVDLVIGNRFPRLERNSMRFLNVIGNKGLSLMTRVALGLPIHDSQCGLRAFKATFVDALHFSVDGMNFATEMIADAHSAGARIAEIPVSYSPRLGKSKLNPVRDGVRICGTVLRLFRDTRPLLFFGLPGVVSGVIGLILGLEVTGEWLTTQSVTRVPTAILSALLMIGSMQLFTLALFADMIKKFSGRNLDLYD